MRQFGSFRRGGLLLARALLKRLGPPLASHYEPTKDTISIQVRGQANPAKTGEIEWNTKDTIDLDSCISRQIKTTVVNFETSYMKQKAGAHVLAWNKKELRSSHAVRRTCWLLVNIGQMTSMDLNEHDSVRTRMRAMTWELAYVCMAREDHELLPDVLHGVHYWSWSRWISRMYELLRM